MSNDKVHMDLVNPSRNLEQKSRKFLKSLTRKEPCELLLVIGTGVSAAVAPHVPALCSWRSCIEAVINAAEDLEVLHPSDIMEFRHKVTEDRDLLVLAHDLIRKMSPRTGDTKPNFFQDCLMEVFDNLNCHIQNPMLLDAILQLMDRGTMVLTTNYDNLLEIFGQQQGKPMESVDLKCKDKEEFQDLYRTKSFVFLGCGETLRDQIFQALFLYSVQDKVDLEHFMLVRKDSHDQFFKLQAEMLLHGIKIVSYGDRFECMPQYFHDLVAQICRHRSPDGSSADSTSLLLGTSCSDCAKRKQEENGDVTQKRIRKANDTDFGGP
ncbi:protein FAM118A-like isoform X3 [Carcharodon carcharias]|uniref:protein FAM118A-like isoform X3 n=1 Tax=Carcharodon carcharias TaxID=13397 RepID=UPI001B7E47E4|nr:protein FAM118A-like isoform X3 [Carcharodon carcharias]